MLIIAILGPLHPAVMNDFFEGYVIIQLGLKIFKLWVITQFNLKGTVQKQLKEELNRLVSIFGS